MNDKIVLVVDDEESVRQFLYDVLTDEGYRVETAANGNECLEKITMVRPDV
ncbi:hypothetical protein N752_09615 [Desulforamulus aquiferis]|nr:hypothetical protein N752_09615 [Desulforamulus aquiferis]